MYQLKTIHAKKHSDYTNPTSRVFTVYFTYILRNILLDSH